MGDTREATAQQVARTDHIGARSRQDRPRSHYPATDPDVKPVTDTPNRVCHATDQPTPSAPSNSKRPPKALFQRLGGATLPPPALNPPTIKQQERSTK